MGWYFFLNVTCKIRPEFKEFVEKKYFETFAKTNDNETLPKRYKDVLDIWTGLELSNWMSQTKQTDDIYQYHIEKKVIRHKQGYHDLLTDMETFLKDIIVPMTSEIYTCSIKSDDCGYDTWTYTDAELRNIPFRLVDKVKSVEHVYNEDRTEIIETRVIYKHGVPKIQFVDLERAYIGSNI